MTVVPLAPVRTLVAISDFQDGWPPAHTPEPSVAQARAAWLAGELGPAPDRHLSLDPSPAPERGDTEVVGGYLERLPLACVRAGLVDRAEIWHHWRPGTPAPFHRQSPVLARRAFRLGEGTPPFRSAGMVGFVEAFGAPHVLCVWGLGVDAALLDACSASFKIYNSIDAPALRIPPDLARRFDLVLTAAGWQSDEVARLHPGLPTAVLPIGPEFADPLTFRPLGLPKRYDVVYVAAAQGYKRHDILFDALATAPRRLRALCVFGYGEEAEALRRQAAGRALDVEFVGPPGVGFGEVNRLMNLATVGVVCGVEDGAPAILTEYMLAGLPVLANAALRCGLDYVLPQTGRVAHAEAFGGALAELVDLAPGLRPRDAALARWTWPHSVRRLATVMDATAKGRALGLGAPSRRLPAT